MADFTITPIPFGGGSLQWNEEQLHLLRLNSNRYIYAFTQDNPKYKFYGIADVSNINDPTPTVNIVKQRAFTGEFSSVRLVALDNDRFVSYDGNDLYVYNVSTNDVVEELKILNYGTQYNGDVRNRSWAIKVSDGIILEGAVVPSNNLGKFDVVLRKLTYNTGTNQFTITTDKILESQITTSNDRYVHIKRIFGTSTKFLVISKKVNAESLFDHSILKVAIYETSTDTISDITPTNIGSFTKGDLIAFSETGIVLFNNSNDDAIEYNGTAFGSTFQYATGGATKPIGDAAHFSGSFGVIFRKDYGVNHYFRIVNRVGPNNVTTSFPTNIQNGLLVTFPTGFEPFKRQPVLDVFDPETLLINGYNTDPNLKQFTVLRFKP